MPVHDDLGLRMKDNYEARSKTALLRRVPVAIRIDGKAFHTFTKGFAKPFDRVLMNAMQETMKSLCENIQGCVLGYTQSDEITLILCDYQTLTTDAWFDYEVQKICSVSASMATMYFNRHFEYFVAKEVLDYKTSMVPQDVEFQMRAHQYHETLKNASAKGAMFDARCFNIPVEEVTNLVYWRQLDATRNSIQMVGQAYFSHSALQGKSCARIQDMLMEFKNINWNNYPVDCKRGACCIKQTVQDARYDIKDGAYPVTKWVIDRDIPIFKGDDREYIERLITFEK